MERWTELKYESWKLTYETLHRWVQIVGKVRMDLSPVANHSWNSTLYLTSRGFTTSTFPVSDGNGTIDFDFFEHILRISVSTGEERIIELRSRSTSDFFHDFITALSELQISTSFDLHPNECADYLGFVEDEVHRTYVPSQARAAFQAFVKANNVLQEFRSRFIGKCSPVHLFWGSFDLATTRFSGRVAPEHPGVAPHVSRIVMKEAYSHEVSSAGFWPGNKLYPHAAFYSYAYPVPAGLEAASIRPDYAFYSKELGEWLLPWDQLIQESDPYGVALDFLQSTYDAAAELGGWDRIDLESSPSLTHLRELDSDSFLSMDKGLL